MDIKKILIIQKVSSYNYYHSDTEKKSVFSLFDEHRKQAIEAAHKKQQLFLDKFKTFVSSLPLEVTYVAQGEEETIQANDFDLIATFGGDGTFLRAAQLFSEKTLVGINSDYHEDPAKGSIGGLTAINDNNYKEAMQSIVSGDFSIDQWKRLYIKINGEQMPELAVNDVYFGAQHSYLTSHFEVYYQNELEIFRGSSGLIAATGMGSSSWFKHALGTPFANDLPVFGFIIRDPNIDRLSKFTKGIVSQGEEITIKPMRDGYVVSFDSKKHNYTLNENDELVIGLSDRKALKVLTFSN